MTAPIQSMIQYQYQLLPDTAVFTATHSALAKLWKKIRESFEFWRHHMFSGQKIRLEGQGSMWNPIQHETNPACEANIATCSLYIDKKKSPNSYAEIKIFKRHGVQMEQQSVHAWRTTAIYIPKFWFVRSFVQNDCEGLTECLEFDYTVERY